MTDGSDYWLEHCRKPRERSAGIEWDVFISYRSADRVWALALYDMLRQAGYKIFLDQFVLTAGSGVLRQLSDNLARSASGVVIWSQRSLDSEWVEREISAMVERRDASRQGPFPYYYVVSKLDSQPLPALLSGSLYLDFSTYPDGPTGAELVRLTSGLQGQAMDPAAVERISAFEVSVREEPSTLRAAVAAKQFGAIKDRALNESPPYTTSATLPALAAQLLISGGMYEDALEVLDRAQKRFRRSIRLRQLRGLVLRRMGRTVDAILELEKLRADGHNDPETLGILAAAWTASYKASDNRDELERARDLYAIAFERTPSDTYSGINAASKSAILDEEERAQQLATQVLSILQTHKAERGGEPSSDYWERVTEPEALFLIGEYEKSLSLYHAARIAHQAEVGSIKSTAAQLELLMKRAVVPAEWKGRFEKEFKAFWNSGARAGGS